MTRILVCGASVFDDSSFVHNSLCEANRIYGPISCIIHNQHSQALAWQQWAMRRQEVRHLPVTEDYLKDGVAAGDRCRDRMFAAKPDMVIIFDVADKDEPVATNQKRSKAEYIKHRALSVGIQVVTYLYDPIEERLRRAAAKAVEREEAEKVRAAQKAALPEIV